MTFSNSNPIQTVASFSTIAQVNNVTLFGDTEPATRLNGGDLVEGDRWVQSPNMIEHIYQGGAWLKLHYYVPSVSGDGTPIFTSEADAVAAGLVEGDLFYNSTENKSVIVGASQILVKKDEADANSLEVYIDENTDEPTVKDVISFSELVDVLNNAVNYGDFVLAMNAKLNNP